jgi:hypothetical protein
LRAGAQRARRSSRHPGQWQIAGRRVHRGRGIALIVTAAALLAVVVWQVVVFVNKPLLADNFSRPDGLITNEFAAYNPHDAAAVRSGTWLVTSGSLFARGNSGWTGVPNRGTPGPHSDGINDSVVFRAVTQRNDFLNVSVSFSLLVKRFMPVQNGMTWLGVHVFLRYQNPDLLYVVSVDRQDGVITVKKKVPGGPSAGGTYYTLAQVHGTPTVGRWEQITASAVDNGEGGVAIEVSVNGRPRLSAVDNGVGDVPPITGPGRVGLRGDYTEFLFDNFTVRKA